MASSDAFVVTVTGRGGHASRPEDAVDPIPVACEIVGALQSMITRRCLVFDPGVLTVASINAGTTSNVIPETAVIKGTMRAVSDPDPHDRARGSEPCRGARGSGARLHCEIEQIAVSYPVTVNAEPGAERMLEVASSISRRGSVGAHARLRSWAQRTGRSCWTRCRVRWRSSGATSGDGPVARNHSNRMLIDEDAMSTGIAMHVGLGAQLVEPLPSQRTEKVPRDDLKG